MSATTDGTVQGTRDDASLIEACLRGHQGAWDELVDRYGGLVYTTARRTLRSSADAEDAFQEVFMILYRKLETLRDRSRLAAWLVQTTVRQCFRMGRLAARAIPADACRERRTAQADEEVSASEERALLREALRRLGTRDERLLRAIYADSGPGDYQAISRELDMPRGSIGPTRARSFAKLQRILADMGLAGPDLAA